jgi:hypothetical protein
MSSVISIVQNAGQSYAGAAQEVAKNISYLIQQDSATVNKTASPMTVPEAGTRYSYEVWIRLRCDLAPNVRVDSIKAWYDSGMPASGYNLTVNSDVINSYQAPVNIQSTRGTRVEFDTKNSEGNSISLDGTLTDVGDYSSWLVFQLEVLSTAETGNFEIEYTIQYDEY